VNGPFDLALHLDRLVGRFAEQQEHDARPSMASMIDSAQGRPGTMSRGAIQQRIERRSRPAQTASAAALLGEA
jgi:hypothetical protein